MPELEKLENEVKNQDKNRNELVPFLDEAQQSEWIATYTQAKNCKQNAQIPQAAENPPAKEELASYFNTFVKSQDCTKKEVCHLMRLLDMDFYRRSRTDELFTKFKVPTLPKSWHWEKKRCEKLQDSWGQKYKPVYDQQACKDARQTFWEGINKGGKHKVVWEGVKNRMDRPAGCYIKERKQRKERQGTITFETNWFAYMNLAASVAGPNYTETDSSSSNTNYWRTIQLCEQDRALDEAQAVYYSPYKVKSTMLFRTQMSTSCSFGMMAELHRSLPGLNSPCARAIAYRWPQEFKNLQAAEVLASARQHLMSSDYDKAQKALDHVKAVRRKFVLIEKITKQWCPGIWNSQQSLCKVPRVSKWTASFRDPEYTFQTRDPKLALTEETCDALTDENLEKVLGEMPIDPPDWWAGATVQEEKAVNQILEKAADEELGNIDRPI